MRMYLFGFLQVLLPESEAFCPKKLQLGAAAPLVPPGLFAYGDHT